MALECSDKSAAELYGLLRKKCITSEEITREVLTRIERTEPAIHAYITVLAERALAQARQADRRLHQGDDTSPLLGIPVAIKDNICVKGVPVTCGSKMLQEFIAPYDATVVQCLREHGAIIIGKTNLDEFAMGSSTETSVFGATRHPHDPARVAGGSSGGSAAAVAVHTATVALGSDTGGSVRQPAAFCGVVGLKPTYGRISRFGLVAFASSFDQIGCLTRTVEDSALLFQVLADADPKDSTSRKAPPYDASTLKNHKTLNGLPIGIVKEFQDVTLEPVVQYAFDAGLRRLEACGVELREISLPHVPYALATYYIIANAEASANLARYDGVRYGHRSKRANDLHSLYRHSRTEGFGPEVKRRILLGTYVLQQEHYAAYYQRAQQIRTQIARDFEQAFQQVELVVSPVTPTPAFRRGEHLTDPLRMYQSDQFTVLASLAGLPAISVPGDIPAGQLPAGIQFIAKPDAEEQLLQTAYAFEQARLDSAS